MPLLEHIHPLRIIREVEKRPNLYSKESAHLNKHIKNQLWTEVAKKLIPEWSTLNELEKEHKVLDLSKKWRNLRDTFIRELSVTKMIQEGKMVRKKRIYVYFKHMSFLIPYIESEELDRPAASGTHKASSRKQEPAPRRPCQALQAAEAKPTTSNTTADIDEDKHFLMSLIPSLKRMTEDDKLAVKMEFLKVIKNCRSKSRLTMSDLSCEVIYPMSLSNEDHDVIKEEDKIERLSPAEFSYSMNPLAGGNSDDDSDCAAGCKTMEE